MLNAILAVIGAALVVWVISALRIRWTTGLTYLQALAVTFFRFVFGVRYRGFEQAAELKGPVVYLVSRQSSLDRALLRAFLPVGTFHIDIADSAERALVLARSVLIGRARICIYAPKEVELDPATMDVLDQIGRLARETGAKVLPIFIGGTRMSLFSDWPRDKAPRSLLPQITVSAGPVITDLAVPYPADLLHDGLMQAKLSSVNLSRTLFRALVHAARLYGPSREILEDSLGGRLSYRQLLIGVRVLGVRFAALAAPGEAVGLLLPNSNGVVLSAFALFSAARPAAFLNHTAGMADVLSALDTARIRVVITSRAFIDKAGLRDLVEAIAASGRTICYLEDIRKQISWREKLAAFLRWRRPVVRSKAEDPAVIVFTSGSEGKPKAVVLSSRNLVVNAAQADCRVDISPADSLFNVLPLFHCFGLLGGMVLPLLYGIRLFLYPSPLHFKLIPSVARKIKPTVLFGTDTFLGGYGRAAKDGDFASVRLIVSGAEAVKPETRKLYRERFEAEIVEGYGMTEAAPVVAVNSATFAKDGTVGRLLPGMERRLEPVEGIEEGGRLFISGPNIMLGYMLPEEPGVLQPLNGKWHDTGDIVSIDERGFITIKGRVKRFAKIAGEMVSLGGVEAMVRQLWPDDEHAAVSVPDKRHGERIVLLTTRPRAAREDIVAYARRYGARELMIPDNIFHVEQLPVLGTGKIDYGTAARIARELVSV